MLYPSAVIFCPRKLQQRRAAVCAETLRASDDDASAGGQGSIAPSAVRTHVMQLYSSLSDEYQSQMNHITSPAAVAPRCVRVNDVDQ